VVHLIKNSEEYKFIAKVYGQTRAKRSQVPYINHIDEGLFILETLFPEDILVQKAFCLHPVFQEDNDLVKNLGLSLAKLDPQAIVLAMEYRHVANAHLPRHDIKKPEEIYLGPLEASMRKMLIADKIQNCKDFELYNHTHSRAERLHHYFHKEWFPRLNVTEEIYFRFALHYIILPQNQSQLESLRKNLNVKR
jgi:hypothetical protein